MTGEYTIHLTQSLVVIATNGDDTDTRPMKATAFSGSIINWNDDEYAIFSADSAFNLEESLPLKNAPQRFELKWKLIAGIQRSDLK